MNPSANNANNQQSAAYPNHKEVLTHPEWVDSQVEVATGVNDGMSFNEAFAAARAEVGPGGCFEWHGQIYGTYNSAEWNSMPPADRDAFNSHFIWNNPGGFADKDTHAVVIDDPDPVPDPDPEIEVIGMSHDDATGANTAGITIDGMEAILVDIDGDMVYDTIGIDVNGDSVIDSDEIADISSEGLTVNDVAIYSATVQDPAEDPVLGPAAPDYTDEYGADDSDITYEA